MKLNFRHKSVALLSLLLAATMPAQSLAVAAPNVITPSAYTQSINIGPTGAQGQGLAQAQAQAQQGSSIQGLAQAQQGSSIRALLESQGAFDPEFYADTYADVLATYGRNAVALEKHYRTFGVYEGRMRNSKDMRAMRFRVVHRIRRFLDYNRDYYLAHYKDAAFPWFDAASYLTAYPEVRTQIVSDLNQQGIAAPTQDQLLEGAVRHYLTDGALEGKKSGAELDPVWAIVADPEIPGAYRGDLRPEDVIKTYQTKTGKTSTQDLHIGRPDGILEVMPETQSQTSGSTGISGSSGGSYTDSSSGKSEGLSPASGKQSSGNGGTEESSAKNSEEEQPAEEKPAEEQPAEEQPAEEEPAEENSEEEQSVEEEPGEENPEEETSPSLTYLMYLCGSDLESKHGEGTEAILCLMTGLADVPDDAADDVTVLICAGGSTKWNNSYLNQHLIKDGAGTAVYKLNREEIKTRLDVLRNGTAEISVPADVQKKLLEVDTANGAVKEPLFSTEVKPNGSTVSGADYDSLMDYLINEDTMPLNELALSTGSESISEKDVLASFLSIAKETDADQYAMTFWNHGAGLTGGVCQDETTEKTLYMDEIRSAIHEQDIKFGLLAFDACFMSSTEGAYYLCDSYDYMAASEEVSSDNHAYNKVLPSMAELLSDPEEAAKAGAMTTLEYRYKQNKGGNTRPDTFAVLDSQKARDAASALNDLAKALLDFAGSDTEETGTKHKDFIYDVLLQARIRSVMFGEGTTRDTSSDYVDAGCFLTRVKAELEFRRENGDYDEETMAFLEGILSQDEDTVLTKAINTVDELAVADYIALNGNYFLTKNVPADGETIPDVNTLSNYWGNGYCSGTSLYIPYFSAFKLKEYRDSLNNPWDESMDYMFGGNSYYQKLINGFLEYIQFNEEGLYETEKSRIDKLKLELTEGKKLALDESGEPQKDEDGNYIFTDEAVTGYENMLSIHWRKAKGSNQKDDYLSIEVNEDAYKDTEKSAYSSGDPFTDMVDTMDTLKLFVTRRVVAKRKADTDTQDSGGTTGTEGEGDGSEGDGEGTEGDGTEGENTSGEGEGGTGGSNESEEVSLEIVVGENTIAFNSVDGVDTAIKVFADTLSSAVSKMVQGTVQYTEEDGTVKELTTTELLIPYHDYDDYDLEKDAAITAVLGEDKTRNRDDYTLFRGTVTLSDDTAEAPAEVCLIFGPDGKGSTVYLGAVTSERKEGTVPEGQSSYKYTVVNGVNGIGFSHMAIITDSSGKTTITYTDDYDLGAQAQTYVVSDTVTVALVNAVDNDNAPGDTNQNHYYFAFTEETGLENYFILSDSVQEDATVETGDITGLVTENTSESQEDVQTGEETETPDQSDDQSENQTGAQNGDQTADQSDEQVENPTGAQTADQSDEQSENPMVNQSGDDTQTLTEAAGQNNQDGETEGENTEETPTVTEGSGNGDDESTPTVTEGSGNGDDDSTGNSSGEDNGEGENDTENVSSGDGNGTGTGESSGEGAGEAIEEAA